ncbi:MAG: penicillin-insensitive murein endopeptidase [Bdellovibrionales bacterium]
MRKLLSIFTFVVFLFAVTGCGENIFAQQNSDPMAGDISTDFGSDEVLSGQQWTQGPIEQARGFYAKGSIISSTVMPASGVGFVKLNPQGTNRFATYDLGVVLAKGAEYVHKYFPQGDRLLIGDLTSQRGGKAGGHSSHQNGLDADIAYFNIARRHTNVGERADFQSMVVNGKISPEFDIERNVALLKGLYGSGRVARIFVHSAVKKAFCSYFKSKGVDVQKNDLLRRLIIYPNHHHHMHVRISCPLKSPTCVNQAPPTETSGC